MFGTAASIAKGMLGSGILSLSAGVAAFTRSPEGLLLAVAMLAGTTVLAAYTFHLVAEVSAWTGKGDFGDAWAASVGERSAWVPRLAVCVISAETCVIYAMILADSLATLLRGALALGSSGGIAAGWRSMLLPWCHRSPVLLALTAFVLLPLCLAESYAGLASTSVVGLSACLYLGGFTLWRALDGSYAAGGRFFGIAAVRPGALVPAGGLAEVLNVRCLVLLSILGTAYMNHGMAPATYQELAPGTGAIGLEPEAARSAKLRRFSAVVALAFAFTGLLCTIVMVAGFCTFGPSSAGMLLSCYAHTDAAAAVARVSVMVSVLFGFPLNFVLLRAEVASALGLTGRRGFRQLTLVLLACNAALAACLRDIGIVQAVFGATMGSFIVFVAPAVMARQLRRRRAMGGWGRAAAEIAIIAAGGLIASVGLAVSLIRL